MGFYFCLVANSSCLSHVPLEYSRGGLLGFFLHPYFHHSCPNHVPLENCYPSVLQDFNRGWTTGAVLARDGMRLGSNLTTWIVLSSLNTQKLISKTCISLEGLCKLNKINKSNSLESMPDK